jgi:HAD superfamily hydrolase (TIGR01549 family)
MKEIKLIILDFDGTLGDTADLIIRTMQATIKELGLPSRTDKECGDMIGLRLIEIPHVLFPECGDISELYASTYRRLFHEFNTDGAVTLYPNVMETLMELKRRGKTLTIASSRSHASLAEYIENLGLSDIISYILGADDVKEGKPNPEAIFKTLERFDFDTDDAIMIGDTVFDINMGINAGVKTCGVTYGNGSRESLSDADWVIDDFGSLLELIG